MAWPPSVGINSIKTLFKGLFLFLEIADDLPSVFSVMTAKGFGFAQRGYPRGNSDGGLMGRSPWMQGRFRRCFGMAILSLQNIQRTGEKSPCLKFNIVYIAVFSMNKFFLL
jgi:hypothetical protein